MTTFQMITAKTVGIHATFATGGTVAPEILNAKNTIISIIYLGALVVVGGRALSILAKGKGVALAGLVIVGGIGLLFINSPETAMNFIKWAVNTLAGHSVVQ